MVGAARKRGEALNHVLSAARPAWARPPRLHPRRGDGPQRARNLRPVVEKAGDLAGLLTNLEDGDLLFIDEIHRIPKTVEEYLYTAMEDFRLDIMIDQGPNARSVRLNLPRFTLVGATTRAGLLTRAAQPLHAANAPRLLRCRHADRYRSSARAGCSRSRSTTRARERLPPGREARRASPTT